jgi:hypothetical protein
MLIAIFRGPGTEDIVSTIVNLYNESGDHNEITVISPGSLIEKYGEQHSAINIKDEDVYGYAEVSNWLENNIDNIKKKGRSVGWYRQQYIKLAFIWGAGKKYFVQDGDTIFSPIFLRNLSSEENILLTTKEKPEIYNNGCRIMGIEKIYKKSFIANGGIFDAVNYKKIAIDIKDWYIFSLNNIFNESINYDFSEYQINGNLILNNRLVQRVHQVKIFRRMDLLVNNIDSEVSKNIILDSLNHYDAISFERKHKRSNCHKLAARLMYSLKLSW